MRNMKLVMLALAMLIAGKFGFAVASPVYLDVDACSTGDEVWYAWNWADGGEGSWLEGSSTGTLVTFECADVSKDNIIFVRMNPGSETVPSWDAKWNQTSDLKVTFGGKYVLTGWGEGEAMNGRWESAEKPLWQQVNPNGANYLYGRKALTGRHCMVNKMIKVVEAGSWVDGLDNMVDEDLSNYAEFPSIASVGVGAKPLTAIRDMENHYAAGTTAGFNLVAGKSSLLDVDVANAYSIMFYLEGKLQQTVAVSSGQDVGGVGLSLINIGGSEEVSIDISAPAPCEFDEIALLPTSLASLSAVTETKIKYAFVGDLATHTITETSMQDYATRHGITKPTLDQGIEQREGYIGDLPHGVELGYWAGSDLINDDLTDGVAWGVLGVGSSLECRVGAAPSVADLAANGQPFKKGMTVGFVYSSASILQLPIGDGIRIRLYKGEWEEKTGLDGFRTYTYYEYKQTEVQDETVDVSVLGLNLISGDNKTVSITAKEDFSHARISFPTGLEIDLGGSKVYYGFVSEPPEAFHECDLQLTANTSVCSRDEQYQLQANPELTVTWTLEEQPSGASATVSATGLLSGMTEDGDYVVRATAEDGCSDVVTVTRGLYVSSRNCDSPMVNSLSGEGDYELSENVNDGGALITINNSLSDAENVLSPTLEDYAIYTSALNATVAENLPIVGVKKSSGLISDGSNVHRIGFVVETQSSGLSLDLINLFNIRTYKNGVQTSNQLIKENNAVNVKLIGSSKSQKLRFAVDIPEGVEFDEFVLWKSGVLSLSIDRFKIYYAFDETVADENEPTDCYDPLACDATIVSNTTGARIDGNNLQFAGGVQVGRVIDNLTYMVDDDMETGVSMSSVLNLGDGFVLSIDLGHVYSPHQQVGIVVDSKTYLAGVDAGNWVTIKTYRNGVEQESQSDWSVLGVSALGYGDKNYIYMTPTKEYDAIRITIAAIASAVTFDSKYYGIFIRNDYDGDGTPDCKDGDSCMEEYTLDEEATTLHKEQDYIDGNLVLHRTFFTNDWDCILLPVDLNWLQVRNAFGNDVEIATPSGYYTAVKKGSKFSVLYYDPITSNDDDVALRAGEYYIIKTKRNADLTEGTYTAKDGNTVNAPVYFIPGVTYRRNIAETDVQSKIVTYKTPDNAGYKPAPSFMTLKDEPIAENIVLYGSQVKLDGAVNDLVTANNYMYDEHNALRQLQADEQMLGFRFYAENNTPNNLIHDDNLTEPTGIETIFGNDAVTRTGVYTIDGRKLRDSNDVNGLPAGFYIVGGKKIVVLK